MDIQDRIKNIKGYFQLFNVVEDMVYVLVKFPKTWTLPDEQELSDGVHYSSNEKGIYFITKDINNIEAVFDSIDYVIDFNKSIEERIDLFNEKIQELKAIFAENPLEELRELKFTFGSDITVPTITAKEVATKKNSKKNNTPTDTEKNKGKEKEEAPNEKKPEESTESSMMALAEELVSE